MTSLLKDDLTVALDEVDRTASRIVTIHDDLAALAANPTLARRLRERGDRHRQALAAFNHARRQAGQTPEVADPERAHLQSLWLALKSAVSAENSEAHIEASLDDLDTELEATIQAARALDPEPAIHHALDDLYAAIN